MYLAATLEQPLLLEGEAGVGKTEVARALASALDARLIRLQCHEGIDIHHAVYDWDYQRQLLAIRAAEHADEGTDPPGDLNATPDYKRHLARVLTRRALEEAVSV